ncbi:GAF domain-containing protein [Gorgonomyces haynaldii]|nr:GAF domain-containing protein [Gorgonomyces haynaldii]
MVESTPVFSKEKKPFYNELYEQAQALIDPALPLHSNLSNIASLIYFALNDAPQNRNVNWAGFYLTENDQLYLGPFQGRIACTVIKFGKGVCGTAAKDQKSQLVPNVHEFPGHIACDSKTESEIVVPLIVNGTTHGVLDLDCLDLNGFDQEDLEGFERIAGLLLPLFQ